MLPFVLAHILLGIESPFYYARSLTLLWTTYVTTYALAFGLLRCRDVERLFEELIILNLLISLVALACLKTPLWHVFWIDDADIMGIGTPHSRRLALLTTEPSVYANLMLPLLVFTILRALAWATKRNMMFVGMIGLPFLLCQSFGGLSMGVAAIGISSLWSSRRFLKRRGALIGLGVLVLALAALLFTNNPISARVLQVLSGGDSSTRSRTTVAFLVGLVVAMSKSIWWGVGLGQGKLVDVSDLRIGFTVGIIPNAVAGTLAELGIVGVAVRFLLEGYLFFRMRVFANSFRMAMFVVAFVAQLTGSYLMDVQQYLIWCFAFLPFFPEFDLGSRLTRRPVRG